MTEDDLNARIRFLEQDNVRNKTELAIVKAAVFGMVALVLTAVVAAMISQVIQ